MFCCYLQHTTYIYHNIPQIGDDCGGMSPCFVVITHLQHTTYIYHNIPQIGDDCGGMFPCFVITRLQHTTYIYYNIPQIGDDGDSMFPCFVVITHLQHTIPPTNNILQMINTHTVKNFDLIYEFLLVLLTSKTSSLTSKLNSYNIKDTIILTLLYTGYIVFTCLQEPLLG